MLAARWLSGKAGYLHQEDNVRKTLSLPGLLLSYSLYSNALGKKSKATPLQERRMIDQFRLNVRGGDGGSGNARMHRSRTDRYGKPDGGNGGRGGDVILRCTSAVWDLRGLQHHITGGRGGQGASKNKIGSRGEDKIVQVPVGTVIHLVEGEIPSTVEKPTSGANPWEIPGTLISDSVAYDQKSASTSWASEMDQMDDGIHLSSPSDHGVECSSHIKSYSHSLSIQSNSQASHPHSKLISTHFEKGIFSGYDNPNESSRSMSSDASYLEINDEMSEESQEDEEEIHYNFAELTEEGQQLIVARGGEGGLGSVSAGRHYRKNLTSDVDELNLKDGLPGSRATLILELKSIADVGLVGMPNAGKSTLLGAISRAKPSVGNYAFTTLRPNIGKLNFDEVSLSVADIPGLIKGAHENRGLGHAFLRHIERTRVLAYVVDLGAALDGRKGIPPWEQLRDLVLELEHYQEGLSDRPSLVVANKIDEVGAECVFEELKRRVSGIPIYGVCAVLEEGILELKTGLRLLVGGGEPARLILDNILVD